MTIHMVLVLRDNNLYEEPFITIHEEKAKLKFMDKVLEYCSGTNIDLSENEASDGSCYTIRRKSIILKETIPSSSWLRKSR